MRCRRRRGLAGVARIRLTEAADAAQGRLALPQRDEAAIAAAAGAFRILRAPGVGIGAARAGRRGGERRQRGKNEKQRPHRGHLLAFVKACRLNSLAPPPFASTGFARSCYCLARRAYPPRRRRGRVAEGGGLLNRYTLVKAYRGFESLRLRQPIIPIIPRADLRPSIRPRTDPGHGASPCPLNSASARSERGLGGTGVAQRAASVSGGASARVPAIIDEDRNYPRFCCRSVGRRARQMQYNLLKK